MQLSGRVALTIIICCTLMLNVGDVANIVDPYPYRRPLQYKPMIFELKHRSRHSYLCPFPIKGRFHTQDLLGLKISKCDAPASKDLISIK